MKAHTVTLPPERFTQLKRLAETEGRSIGDLVAGFLDQAIEAQRLPDDLPGWDIRRLETSVLLAHPASGFVKLLPAADATSIGETLRQFGEPAKGRAAFLDLDAMIEIRRQGAGVVMRDANSFAECSTAANVAADVGKRLVRAAA